MHIHAQPFELPEIEVGRFKCRPDIPVGQVDDPHHHRLLIQPGKVGRPVIDFSLDAGRDHVVDRRPPAILFDVHGRQFKAGFIGRGGGDVFTGCQEVFAGQVAPPFTPHKVEAGKTQHNRFREILHEHTHETDGPEIGNATDCFVGVPHGDLKLVPGDVANFPVGQGNPNCLVFIGDVVLAHDHFIFIQVDAVLVVAFPFAQGVVCIDIFNVGLAGVPVINAAGNVLG